MSFDVGVKGKAKFDTFLSFFSGLGGGGTGDTVFKAEMIFKPHKGKALADLLGISLEPGRQIEPL